MRRTSLSVRLEPRLSSNYATLLIYHLFVNGFSTDVDNSVTCAILVCESELEREWNMKRIIAYLRVSTQRQGESGLGLDAQDNAVKQFAGANSGEIIKTYIEVESGRKNDRPELAKALAHARRIKATLVFAKVDRLARNARFLLAVVESGADVVFCDLPNIPPGPTGKFILTQMASVAELEAGLISKRTKDALAEAKKAGKLLGGANPKCRNLSAESMAKGQQLAADARRRIADEAYSDLYPIVTELRASGMSLRAIAESLNAEGYQTRRNKPWNAMQVRAVLNRAAALA